MYAIVKTGGKQYKVASGDIVAVEKIDGPVGTEIALPALLLVDGDDVVSDQPGSGRLLSALPAPANTAANTIAMSTAIAPL